MAESIHGGSSPECTKNVWKHTESFKIKDLIESIELTVVGGIGNPLQCSCLENPGDGGAWRAALYGVPESDTTEATYQKQQQQGKEVQDI